MGTRAEIHSFDVGHFGIYTEPVLSEVLELQTRFLVKELGG